MPPSASIAYATSRLSTANLEALQVQLRAAQANGAAREECRKAMCRIQKAGYEMDLVFSAATLQKPRYIFKEWMEDHSS